MRAKTFRHVGRRQYLIRLVVREHRDHDRIRDPTLQRRVGSVHTGAALRLKPSGGILVAGKQRAIEVGPDSEGIAGLHCNPIRSSIHIS
jgi:hypothetical protein